MCLFCFFLFIPFVRGRQLNSCDDRSAEFPKGAPKGSGRPGEGARRAEGAAGAIIGREFPPYM